MTRVLLKQDPEEKELGPITLAQVHDGLGFRVAAVKWFVQTPKP